MFSLNDCLNENSESQNQLQIADITYNDIERIHGEDSDTLKFNDLKMIVQYDNGIKLTSAKVIYDYVQLSLESQEFVFGTILEGTQFEIQTTCIFNKIFRKLNS